MAGHGVNMAGSYHFLLTVLQLHSTLLLTFPAGGGCKAGCGHGATTLLVSDFVSSGLVLFESAITQNRAMKVHGRYWKSLVTVLKLLSWFIHIGNWLLLTLPYKAPPFLCYFIAGSGSKLAHIRVSMLWPFKWLFPIYVCACIILFIICVLNYMECLE